MSDEHRNRLRHVDEYHNNNHVEDPNDLSESYPLDDGELAHAPRPFAVPSDPHLYHPWTSRVTCVARRESKCRNDRVVFYIQGVPGVFNTRALFVAQRQRQGKYYIFNVYNDNTLRSKYFETKEDRRYIGKITKRCQHKGFVDFTLMRGTKQVSATIYNASSLRYPVVDGSADRIAYSIIYDEAGVGDIESDEDENSHQQNKKGHKKTATSMDKLVQAHIHDNIHQIGDEYNNVKVYQSKRRFTKKSGRNLHQDVEPFLARFGRRAQWSSKKNLQLMNAATGQVILQMGRWNDNEFTVDFLPPYTPYDAFGFVLAQLEAN